MSWQTITDDREKYKAYLCSREWALLRNAVRARCGGKCERCNVNDMECVHHLTYARKYDERIEDLAGWCNACHEFTHGRSDHDPASWIGDEEEFQAWAGALAGHRGWRDLTSAMILGHQIIGEMGLDWAISASRGDFKRRSVEEDDLQKLIATRRQEQGIT